MVEQKKAKTDQTGSKPAFIHLLLAEIIDWAIILGFFFVVICPVLQSWSPSLKLFLPEAPLPNLLWLVYLEDLEWWQWPVDWRPYLLIPTIAALYRFSFERFRRGQTPGKRMRGLRVARRDGTAPRIWENIRHAGLLILGMLTFWAVFARGGRALLDVNSTWSVYQALWWSFAAASLAYLLILWFRRGRRLGGVVVTQAPVEEIAEAEAPQAIDLPEPPDALISNIASVSENAKGIYFVYSGLLAFFALTVAGSSDRQIVLGESTNLPIINVSVSMDGFFLLAPLLSIFIFIYFQIYLSKLRRLFHRLRTEYRTIDEEERVYPWMLNFVDQPGTGFAARFIVAFSVWWSLPLVLMILALWYLKKHEPLLGTLVGLTPLVGTLVVLSFWARPPGECFKLARPQWTLLVLVVLFEVAFFGLSMPRAFRGERLIGAWPAVDVRHENLMSELDSELAEFKTLYRVDLEGARLQGADFTGSILNKANLQSADLQGVCLAKAYLEEANLTGTNLLGANLVDAKLNNALVDSKVVYGKLTLRANADTLAAITAYRMVHEFAFFDNNWNPSASGCFNVYELIGDRDLVVFDHTTGLTWEESGSSQWGSLAKAGDYIRELRENTFAGYNDWRLPTLEEAMSLLEPRVNEFGLHIDPVFDTRQDNILTSDRDWTTEQPPRLGTYTVHFKDGGCGLQLDSIGWVRAVRGGQAPTIEEEGLPRMTVKPGGS